MEIRELREAAGLTQGDVARRLNISVSQYSRYESNPGRIRAEMVAQICQILGISQRELSNVSDLANVIPLAAPRRVVRVYAIEGVVRVSGIRESARTIGEYSPSSMVSSDAYAVVAFDDALTNLGPKSIYPGDWCVVDPSETPKPGDVVHAVDPHTDLTLLRIYRPLHPSNARAPGYILAATTPGFDEIYVPGRGGIEGVVVEKRAIIRR